MIIGKNWFVMERWYLWVLATLILAVNLQNISLSGVQAGVKSLRLFHAMSLFCLPILFMYRVPLPSIGAWLFLSVIFLSSVVSFFLNSLIDTLLITYGFVAFLFLIAATLASLTATSVIPVLRICASVIMVSIWMKALVFKEELLLYLADPFFHPDIPWFYVGGANLEATWVALSVLFFVNTRWFYTALLAALGISVLYASRVGVVAVILVWFYQIFSTPLSWRVVAKFVLGGFATTVIVFTLNPFIIERFVSIGYEGGSLGRFVMWEFAWEAFLQNPIVGVGAGNTMQVIERVAGRSFVENNIHNYFLQTLIDFGVIGFAAYCVLLFQVLRREWRSGFKNPLGMFVLLYAVLSLVQFKGAEPNFWVVLGMYEGMQARWAVNPAAGYLSVKMKKYRELIGS